MYTNICSCTVVYLLTHECLQSQKTLKASHDSAVAKVNELSGQLKEERLKSLGLEKQFETKALQERRTSEVLLKTSNRWTEVMKGCQQFTTYILSLLLVDLTSFSVAGANTGFGEGERLA